MISETLNQQLSRLTAKPTEQQSVDQFIGQLYCDTDKVSAKTFRHHCLEQLAQVIKFDGAIWSNGSQQQAQFNSHTLIGVTDALTDSLIKYKTINPLVPALIKQLGQAIDMSDLLDDDIFYQSDLYRDCFKPHGIERILASLHLDQRSGIFTLLTLYRFDRDCPFNQAEKQTQNRILFHLLNAANHSWSLVLKQSLSSNSFRAIVDHDGVFHQVQPPFLDLVDQCFSLTNWPKLPFEVQQLPFDQPIMLPEKLTIKLTKFNQLIIIDIWLTCSLDTLSQREHQVMSLIKQGQSAKQVAKALNLAPSTVSNHLYRIFEKLNICNRSQLQHY